MLLTQIGLAHVVVVHEILRVAALDDVAGLKDVGTIGDGKRHLRVLLDEVRAMPSFPAEGSLKYVDDVLVIKLSENE